MPAPRSPAGRSRSRSTGSAASTTARSLRTTPDDYQHCAIALDAGAGSVRFTVDGVLVYRVPSLPVIPTQLHVGMGLMTLLPIQDGRSVSVRGQGMAGRWRNFGYRVD